MALMMSHLFKLLMFASLSRISLGFRGQIHRNCTTPGMIALTFDDGPHPTLTGEVLDVLKSYNVRATFFLNGFGYQEKDLPRYRQTVRRIFNEGHQIGSHTWSHKQLPTLTLDKLREEFSKVADQMREMLGVNLTVFRPPGGLYNEQVVRMAEEDHNYATIMWNLDTRDWAHPGDVPASMVAYTDRTINAATESYIAIHHDPQPASPRLAQQAIQYVLDQGELSFVTLSQCIGVPMYQ